MTLRKFFPVTRFLVTALLRSVTPYLVFLRSILVEKIISAVIFNTDHPFKDVLANCFCASLLRTAAHANSHATSCIERARQELKWTMIGQIAIAIALLGFNALGRSVTPTFLSRNRFYLQLSPHCSKMNKKSMWEVEKIGIPPSCGCKARETMVSKCELILWGTSSVG